MGEHRYVIFFFFCLRSLCSRAAWRSDRNHPQTAESASLHSIFRASRRALDLPSQPIYTLGATSSFPNAASKNSSHRTLLPSTSVASGEEIVPADAFTSRIPDTSLHPHPEHQADAGSYFGPSLVKSEVRDGSVVENKAVGPTSLFAVVPTLRPASKSASRPGTQGSAASITGRDLELDNMPSNLFNPFISPWFTCQDGLPSPGLPPHLHPAPRKLRKAHVQV